MIADTVSSAGVVSTVNQSRENGTPTMTVAMLPLTKDK